MKLRWLLLLGVILSVICQAGCGGGGGGGGDGGGEDPAPPGDLVAPFVISTNPTQNSTGVLVNRDISATFSEAIAPATLSSQSIVLIDDATDQTVPGYSIQYDASSKTVILSNADLEPASTYIVTLTTAIKDLAGNPMKASYNLRFSTYVPPPVNPPPGGSEDTTPPVVRSTFPVNNAPNVSLQTTLAASFSEALNSSTVNAQTFTLRKNGAPVAGTVSYAGTSAVFTPNSDLEAGASYVATLSSAIKDLAGNALQSYSWIFSTQAPTEDVTPPRVLTVFPADGAQNVSVDTYLRMTFNEPVRPFEFGTIDGEPVEVTFDLDYMGATMQPAVPLKPGRIYTSRVTITDMAGNVAAPYTWSFTTSP
jgi:hypothetical protein